MAVLDKKAILDLRDVKVQKIRVPQWDEIMGDEVEVYIRRFTAGDRDYFEKHSEKGTLSDARSRIVVAGLCDEKGNALFTPEEFGLIAAKDADAVTHIFSEILTFNGMGKDNKALEQAEKNSEAIPGEDSTTA